MLNKIIVVGLIAAVLYYRGARSHRPVKARGKQPETLRAQAERLWRDPETAKARKKLVKNLSAKAQDLASRRG